MRRPDLGRVLTAAAGVLAVVGAALPYYTFPNGATATVWSRGLFPTATLAVLLCVLLGVEAVAELIARRELPSPLLNFSWEQVRLAGGAFATALALSYLVQGRAGADLGAGYYLVALASLGLLAGGVLSRRSALARAPSRFRRADVAEADTGAALAGDDWLDDPELLALLADDGEGAALTTVEQPPEPEPAPAPVAVEAVAPEPEPEPEPEPVAVAVAVEEPEPTPAAPAAPSVSLVVVPAAGNGKAGEGATPAKRTRRPRKASTTRKASTRKTTGTRKATGTRAPTTRTRRRPPADSDGQHGEEPGHNGQAEQPDADPAQDDTGDGHAAPGDGTA